MRHDAWRRDAASYPLRGELAPRYTDVDIWQHLNNTALISLQGEAVQHGLHSVFGPDAWRDTQPALACATNATDFLAEAFYPEPLDWGARVLGVDEKGVRIATALFQRGKCVGLHEASCLGWTDGQSAGFGAQQLAALQAAAVPGADALPASFAPAGLATPPAPAHFPWHQTVGVRFGDADARRLASDTWLARCAEQMRVTFLNEAYGAHRVRGSMMVAHVSLRWMRRRTPAHKWELGCGIANAGERSLTVRGAVFEAGECVAVCDSVLVAIDRETRRSTKLSDESRALLVPYHLGTGPSPAAA